MDTVEHHENTYHANETSWQPWIICLSATLFFFYEFIQGNMFASIAQNIMADFHVEADKMAYMSSIYYVSNVLFLFLAGMMLDRFSIKKTILAAMSICVISTFILANSQSFYLALVCRFLTGIGSAFCLLGPVRLASQWFPPHRMALVTGVIVTMAMTGGMLAQTPLTLLVNLVGWRHAVEWVGVLGVIMLFFMSVWIKEKPHDHPPHPFSFDSILDTAKKVYSNAQFIMAGLYTSLMNMAIAVFGAMMGTLYLQQRFGIPNDQASLINTMLFLGAIFGGPVIGALSDKWGLRLMPMKLGVAASLLTVLTILYLPVSYGVMMVLFFMLGFFTSAQVISYALVAESSSPLITASAVSVISILTQGGYVLYQNLFSRLLMSHGEVQFMDGVPIYSLGDYQYAAIMLPFGLLMACFLVFRLKETYCKHQVH